MSPELSIVLVGATGFVGSALLRQISHRKIASSNVHALVRQDTASVQEKGVRVFPGDLFSIPRELFPEKPYVVLHFGTKQVDRDRTGFWENNVGGTRNLLSSLTSSCAGIIYGSSMSVYGQGEQNNVNEEATLYPGTALASSRVAAESCIENEAKTRGISALSLRPRFILGEGDQYTIPGLVSLFRKNLSIHGCKAKYSIVDVDDYASIILRLAESFAVNAPRQSAMNVGLSTPLTFTSLENVLIKTLGISRPFIRLPLGKSTIRITRFIPAKKAASLATKLELLCQNHYGNMGRLEAAIGREITSQDPAHVAMQAAQKSISKVNTNVTKN